MRRPGAGCRASDEAGRGVAILEVLEPQRERVEGHLFRSPTARESFGGPRAILHRMSVREVVFLGTASQVPTRRRNHNALFLRWDGIGILFDPGEGTQRQLLLAGIATTQITHIAITHFHGDHCLGLAGVIQRISLDRVPHEIPVIFPASGQVFFERLRHASLYDDHARIVPVPVRLPDPDDGQPFLVAEADGAKLFARPLSHRCECFGYVLIEPDGHRMLPEKLNQAGIRGPDVGNLLRDGQLRVGSRDVRLEEVSEHRPGQRCAVVMDTRPCSGAHALAEQADLLVIESTFLNSEASEADAYAHLTAAQAAQIGRDAGVRRVALTHFSQRYTSMEPFHEEASEFHPDVVVAEDFTRVVVPPRR